ncbi:hypothetical protein [Streptomyces sp. TBY4]|uniref:hypothetical protein n=1 Tax=Streptomyces sp. TBY4 TaxID=2962030 RepID=UPI0020B793A3|nr:hypothetical protein [Streptomyces sp. TBY4]MCP3753319.1 hypothetical protein [Streptomyces sp. TBY4]
MSDPQATQLATVPGCRPEQSRPDPSGPSGRPGPLPCCPVCDEAPERISWRQRPGQPVVLVFDPCGHRHGSPAAPVLAVSPAPVTGWGRALA